MGSHGEAAQAGEETNFTSLYSGHLKELENDSMKYPAECEQTSNRIEITAETIDTGVEVLSLGAKPSEVRRRKAEVHVHDLLRFHSLGTHSQFTGFSYTDHASLC